MTILRFMNFERILTMYIELREKKGKFYVLMRHEDSKEKPVAQFASSKKDYAISQNAWLSPDVHSHAAKPH